MVEMKALRRGSIWLALCAILLFGSSFVAQPSPWEVNTDRPGMDYKSIYSAQGWYVTSCEYSCRDDPQCQAWTDCLNFESQESRCYLKSGVPTAVAKDNCVSGTKALQKAKPHSTVASRFLMANVAPCSSQLAGFLTTSPLPATGVGWDYKVKLEVTGGVPPIQFLTPYFDPATGVLKALSCSSGGSTSGPAYYPGKMMVGGLTLRCDGTIVGQSTTRGNYTVTVIAADSCSPSPQRVEHNFVLEVRGPS